MTMTTHTMEDTSMSMAWAEKEESKMGHQGDDSSGSKSCNDGDSDSNGCNDLDDNGNNDATDYDNGDGGNYYECVSGGRST